MSRNASWLALATTLAAVMAIGICAGHVWHTPATVVAALAGDQSLASKLLVEWRLPRVVAAAVVGALLGVSGAIFQGVFRNPLAEPYLLGSAGGAAFGATIALLVPLALPQWLTLPLLAFLGAWGATVLVIGVARAAGSLDVATLLLAGVAVAAILGALRSFLMLALSDETVNLQVVLSWILGGMQSPSWSSVGLLALAFIAGFAAALALARGLDRLGLGEDVALTYGLNTSRFVGVAVMLASAIVAAAVTVGGLVGFVGLAAPHIARWIFGALHRHVVSASALIGAILVSLADVIARSALPPAEIPLGLITALAGAPFFIVLLARSVRR